MHIFLNAIVDQLHCLAYQIYLLLSKSYFYIIDIAIFHIISRINVEETQHGSAYIS